MIAVLVAVAVAASPGGFRVDPAVPVDFVQLRQVWVATAPGVAQTVVRGQAAVHRYSLDAQLPVVATWERGWSDAGLGQLRVGARRWQGTRARPWTWGLEVAFPVVPRHLRVTAWGSAARETVPGVEAEIFFETAWMPDAPAVFRMAVGWRRSPYVNAGFLWTAMPLLDLALVKVVPVGGLWSVVIEGELLVDPSVLSVRPLLRVDPTERVSFDVGVQVPVDAFLELNPSVQLIAQGRCFF